MPEKIRTRRFIRKFFCIFLPVVILLATVWGGYSLFDRYYLFIDGDIYKRDLTQLDLSQRDVSQVERIAELSMLQQLNMQNTGMTAEEYEMLQTALPDCEILWNPCFQGTYYSLNVQSLTIQSLSEAEVEYLDYFQDLTYIDAMGCQDYDAIMALIARRPDCEIAYQVSIGQEAYLKDGLDSWGRA